MSSDYCRRLRGIWTATESGWKRLNSTLDILDRVATLISCLPWISIYHNTRPLFGHGSAPAGCPFEARLTSQCAVSITTRSGSPMRVVAGHSQRLTVL